MAGNDLTAFVPQVWSRRVLTRLDQINVALACGAVNRDYEGEIRQQGDTVWVRTFGNVTFSPYKRGGPINYGTLAPTKESLVVNDAQSFAFQVDDLDQAQNDISALDGYTERAAVALNNVVEAKAWSIYAKANAANQLNNGGVAYTIDATNAYSTLVLARKALNKQNVLPNSRWAVLGPAYEAALLQDAKWLIRATDMGDTIVSRGLLPGAAANTIPGFIGQCAGFNCYVSNVLPSDSGGTYALFGGAGVISYAGQIRKLERIRLQDTFADAVRGLVLHDDTVFNEHAKALGSIYYVES